MKLLLGEKLCLLKEKMATSPKNPSLCTHCKKIGHTQFKCYTKFLERFESQMSRLLKDYNSLKNIILNNGKGNKPN